MRKLWMSIITVGLLAVSAIGAAAQDDPSSRPPIPSAGCGTTEVQPGTQNAPTTTVGDDLRLWDMYVPEAHDGLEAVPLWIQLHGSGASGPSIVGLSSAAEEFGFVVAAPRASLGNDRWMWWLETSELDVSRSNPDIAFIDALIDHLGDELCIDLARIYAAGFSAGGAGVSILGCALADRLAAVAPVARTWELGGACDAARAVPHLAVHGTNDGIIKWDGGFGWADRSNLPMLQVYDQAAIADRVAGIATRNGCGPDPSIEAVDETWERWRWACPTGAEVELLVHGGGYNWGPLGTTELVWAFFEQHPMPDQSRAG